MFRKILIANRGEIACRVIRTARRLGIATVAVYSEADKDARHVAMADEAACIGPPPSRESYLDMDRILGACRQAGAEAVHPGYGFLSENAEFARRLDDNGIAFIGPGARAIAAMGDKIASKKLAREAGVSTIPGFNDPIGSAEEAVELARRVGYPVMLKASAGGGGKGLRVAYDDEGAREGFQSCRMEARNAFGDDRIFLEKFIEEPRHIEIQVLGDAHGHVVHLGERECSIQRRHQKVIEEAPSPFLDEATRKAMGEQAVALAKAVRYQSAGTVEFVVGGRDRRFYFLEMNTRLQVEHPVTEMITGLDLVEWMIRVAAGEPLPFAQDQIRRDGWAIECRINAEDPHRNFLPSTGRLVRFLPPEPVEGSVRIDTGVEEGDEISIHYDSMIAKLIVHDRAREQAIARMDDALNAFVIRGVRTNIPFQSALMNNPRFTSGNFHTGLIAEEFPGGLQPGGLAHRDPLLLAAAAAYARRRYIQRATGTSGQLKGHGRRVDHEWVVLMQGEKYPLTLQMVQGGSDITYQGKVHALRTGWKLGDLLLRGTWDNTPVCLQVERLGLRYRVSHNGSQVDAIVMTGRAADLLALMPDKPPPDLSKLLIAPMPGLLTELAVKVGQEVRAGEKLASIEAMKMQNVLKAEADGVVAEVLAQVGDSLAVDQPILRFR
ncbi:MAG: acetyl/propionyl/methylcrotonyl-CoA carboxylase subunit alpha [Isosphaeraceae bacterium]